MPYQNLAVGSSPSEVIAAAKVTNGAGGSGNLSFPSNLGNVFMAMNFSQYAFNPGGTSFGTVQVNGGSIRLPVPTNLIDDTSLNAGEVELGLTGAAIYEIASALEGGIDARSMGTKTAGLFKNVAGDITGIATEAASSGATDAVNNIKAYGKLAGRAILSSVPGAGAAIDAATGTTLNPFATVDFNGVRLKTHNFKWTLSPKNEQESVAIRNIINELKRNSLPSYLGVAGADAAGTLKNALLSYPNLVTFGLVGIDQSFYYRFKPAMIRNVSVAYNTGDRLTVVEGGRPATVELSIEAIETGIHVSSDYGGGSQLQAAGGETTGGVGDNE